MKAARRKPSDVSDEFAWCCCVVLAQRLAANAGLRCTHLEPLCDLKQRGLVFLVPARWRGHGSTLASRGHGAKRYRCHTTHSLTNTHTHTHTHTHTQHTTHAKECTPPLLRAWPFATAVSFLAASVHTVGTNSTTNSTTHTHTPPSASRGSRPSPVCTSFTLFSNSESRLIPAPPVWLHAATELLRAQETKRWRSFV